MDDHTDDKKSGKLITFPGGKKSDEYIIGSIGGDIPTPDILDPIEISKENVAREAYVQNQELTKTIKDKLGITETIDVVLKEIAEELGHLKFERQKAAQAGKNTANYTIGRINSLRNLAELLLKKKESLLQEELDLKSPRFQAVFKIWMEFFHESMIKSGINPEEIDLVFQQMKSDMIDWEKRMSLAGVDKS